METDSRKSVDDSLKYNADNASGAGLEVLVTRIYDGVGVNHGKSECQWCLDRCGEDMTLEEAYRIGAFQRHPGCGCIIEYTSKKGQKSIQTGTYKAWNYQEELEKRKEVGLDSKFFIDELSSRIEPYIEFEKNKLIGEAKAGGLYHGDYQQALRKPKKALEKSIKTHIQVAEEHEWKIRNPALYMEWGDPNNQRDVENAASVWRRHRRRNAQVAALELDVWRELYG